MSKINEMIKHTPNERGEMRKPLYISLKIDAYNDMENWRFKDESKIEFITDAIRCLIAQRQKILDLYDD